MLNGRHCCASAGTEAGDPEEIAPVEGGTEDYSRSNAPKVIKSRDIEEFSYEFDNSSDVYDESEHIENGNYSLSLRRLEGGRAALKVDFYNRFNEKFSVETEVPAAALEELQRIIEAEALAKINGWHKRNSALGCSFELRVLYASRERLSASGEGGCSVVPDQLDSAPFLKLFKRLSEAAGCRFGLDDEAAEEESE